MFRTLTSFRGLILVFGLVALGLPSALVGQIGIVRTLNAVNQELAQTREGQLAAADVLQLQVDEETGVRAYAATHQTLFLEPYRRARAQMPLRLRALAVHATHAGAPAEAAAVAALAETNATWLRTFAAPVVRGEPDSITLQVRGKQLVDRFRRELRGVRAAFAARYRTALEQRDRTSRTATAVALVAITLIAFEAIVFALLLARLQRDLDREHGVAEALQTAAAGRLVPPGHLALGTAYRSATRGARVGGDVYDVYRLDSNRTLLLVGDVSGKGLVAAVDTTFVRYAVRTLAGEGHAPATILARFDALYQAADGPLESFVTLFVGIHDRRDGSLAYANAGHEACWIRRGGRLEALAPTGPLIGLAGLGAMTYANRRAPLAPGDLLVLATDGLTEARDRGGAFVAPERVHAWIAGGDASSPQRFVDELLATIARYARGRTGDDLALLAVAPVAPARKEEPPARSG